MKTDHKEIEILEKMISDKKIDELVLTDIIKHHQKYNKSLKKECVDIGLRYEIVFKDAGYQFIHLIPNKAGVYIIKNKRVDKILRIITLEPDLKFLIIKELYETIKDYYLEEDLKILLKDYGYDFVKGIQRHNRRGCKSAKVSLPYNI